MSRTVSASRVLAFLVALIGMTVLAGWSWDIQVLKSAVPGLANMRPGAALGLVMAGIALLLLHGAPHRYGEYLARLCAGGAVAIGALTLAEYSTGRLLGVDEILAPASGSGHMAFITALCLVLNGCAIMLLGVRPRLAQWLAASVLGLAVVSVAGYIFGVRSFYTLVSSSSIALHTGAALLLLALATLLASVSAGFMGGLAGRTLGGVMFRRLLLIPLMMFLIGWLALRGSRAGWYDAEFRLALLVVSGAVCSILAAGILARSLDALDGQRQQLLRRLEGQVRETALAAAIVDSSEDAVISKSLDGRVLSWNPGAERIFGYAATEMLGQSILRLFPPERVEEEARLIAAIRSGKRVSHFQTKRIGKSGAVIDVSVTLSPIRNERGEIFAVSKIVRDIGEELRRQEAERAAAIIDNSEDAILADSPEGIVLSWNKGAQKLYGYSAAEMVGTPIERLLPADCKNEQSVFLAQLSAGLPVSQFETRRVRKDGTVVDVSITVSAIRDPQGSIVALSKVAQNITDRKRAEAAQALLAAVVAGSDDAIISQALDGTVLSWNAGAERIFGYSAAEMIGQTMTRLFPADRIGEEAALVQEMRAGREVAHFDTRRVRKDGSSIDVSVSVSPIVDGHGALVGFSRIARDITERLRLAAQESLARALSESESRLRLFIERAPTSLAMFDKEMKYVAASANWCRDYGVRRDAIIGRCHYEVFPEITPAWREVHRRALAGETVRSAEDPFVRADGTTQWLSWEVSPWLTTAGDIGGIVIVSEDITANKLAEEKLAAQHALMRVTLDSIADAVITTDRGGRVEWLNPVASRLTGWALADARGKPIDQVFHILDEDTGQPLLSPARCALDERRVSTVPQHTLLFSKDGVGHCIEDSAAPIRADDGGILGVVLVFHDVTEQRRLAREVRHRASHDALTGLANRFEFEGCLRRALSSAREEGREHALMFIDLDQFKLVNDACGHAAGDRLLREVATLFQGAIRSGDTLARLGGDEFGLLLEQCNVMRARRIGEQLCDRLEHYRFVHDERRFRVGASIGVAPLDSRWSSESEAMQAADTACYAAKEAGRNRVHEWREADRAVKTRQGDMRWVTRLESALDEHRFRLYAQRIEPCLATASGMQFEVLLRLEEADGVIVAPSTFFPAAERFNMASRLDRWVIREVVDWMSSHEVGALETVTVNLSGQSIGDRSFHRYAADQIARLADPRRLCFEITETAAITQIEDAQEFIGAMRRSGVRIALDDFGAGVASFGYLKTLRVDWLKIDGGFIRDILQDPLDRTAVCCFRDIAAVCGMQTVAECVETAEVLAELRRIGIDFVQGYYLHRPQPLAELAVPLTGERRLPAPAQA